MKRAGILGITLLAIFTLFFSGYFRHDIDESKISKLASEKQFDCVGRAVENGKTAGSAVLIAPKYVLSAGHILLTPNQLFKKNNTIKNADPEDFQFEFAGKSYQAKRFIVHPDLIQNGPATGHDLFIIELETEVKGIEPAYLNRNFDEMKAEVTGVGFGSYGIVKANGAAENMQHGKKSAGRNIIDEISGREINGKATQLKFDFDSPTNPDVNKMGDAKSVDMEYITAGGDSGGGLFRYKNNKWELVGILHGSDASIENFKNNGYYGEISIWTRVSAFVDWIEKEIK